MGETLLWFSAAGAGALWLAAYFFSARQSRVGVQLVFLAGMLIAWPALTVGLGGAIFDVIFPPEEGKPVGPGGAIVFLFAGGVALLMWLTGFWAARIVGWGVRRRRTEAYVKEAA
jgi:hypothetical protein